MRADRLIATLLLMQSRGRVTAAELAAELDVSVATARRDLEALSAAGVPVYPQPGRHGGWSLVGGARTDLTGLTSSEAQALFLLLGPGVAVEPDAKSALRKMLRALPAPFRAHAQAAADAVIVDSAGWGTDTAVRPLLVEALRGAIIGTTRVEVAYTDARGTQSTRGVDPLGLVDKDGTWYLVAQTARGTRTFRVDRIGAVTVIGERFTRPDEFDLGVYWQRTVGDVERHRSGVRATVSFPERILPVVERQFGRHLDVHHVVDGHVTATVAAHIPISIAERLAGWGALVDVHEPESVRHELARIGAELMTAYAVP